MSTVKLETAPYREAFRNRPQDTVEPNWLTEQRDAALARFESLGFPSRREEAWRFTDLRPLQKTNFPLSTSRVAVSPAEIAPWRLAATAHRIVLVNGRFAPELSEIGALPVGAWLASTARTLAERPALLQQAFDASDSDGAQSFASLNAALFSDGFVLALEPGIALDRPVEIIHLGRADTPVSLHLRSAILLAPGSRATVIETFAGRGSYWTNAVATLRLGAGATLRHLRLQDESDEAVHLLTTRAALDRGADYDGFLLTLGARLSRQDVFVRFEGADARCGLNGAFLLRGEAEATTATFIDHASPGGVTRELFKGVVEDRAHGVFLGKIAVRPDAQRTDAHQLNRNLLLSRRASVDTKPEFEILADDVKCNHGATVGDLDEAALFYLRARGIPEAEARRLLVEAFAAETLDRIEDGALRAHFAKHLTRWLGQGGGVQ